MHLLTLIFFAIIGGLLADVIQKRKQAASRLDRLEQKMDLILTHLGIVLPALHASQQVIDLIEAGQKIQAIKVYRQETGAGLAESKEAVDKLAHTINRLGSAVQPAIGQLGEDPDQQYKTQVKRGLG